MLKNALRFFWVALLMTTTLVAQAGGAAIMQAGWQHFYTNNYAEARKSFLEASNSSETKAEAHLALALTSSMIKGQKDAFQQFQAFYDASENPDPALFALWSDDDVLGFYGGKLPEEKVLFLQKIVDNPKTHGTLKAMANLALGKHYRAAKDFKKAEAYNNAVGAVYEWSLVGEFENISGSGFDKPYAPIAHPEADYEFTNKKGSAVKWFPLVGTIAGDWVNFANHFNYRNSVIYAQSFVQSPNEQQVELRVGTSGSLKVWVNDQLVISELEERNNDVDTYVAKVTLAKGDNRILLQVGESEAGRSNFMLRFTDEKGQPVAGLTASNQYKPYKKATKNTKVVSNAIFAEDALQQKIDEQPENLLNYLLLTKTYLRNDKNDEARRVLDKAVAIAPKSTFVLWEMVLVQHGNENQTEVSRLVEQIKKDDPSNPIALNMRYNEALEKDELEKAEEILNEIVEGQEDSEYALRSRIRFAFAKEETEKGKELLLEGYKRFPENTFFMNQKYRIVKSEKSTKAGMKVLKTYLKSHYDESVMKNLGRDYEKISKPLERIAILEEIVANDPDDEGLLGTLGSIYQERKDYTKAEMYFKRCLELSPYYAGHYGKLASLYKEWGKNDLAIEYFEKAISFNPFSYGRREELRQLKGAPEVFGTFGDSPDLEKVFADDKTATEDYPEDNSVFLHDELRKVVYPEGGYEEKYYILVKMLNIAGVDEWKEQNIYGDIEEAKVLKKDGSQIQAERSGGHMVFTDLGVGDAIMLVFKQQGRSYSSHSSMYRQFTDRHYFNNYVPIKESSYKLRVPEGFKFHYQVLNSDLKPTIEKKEGNEFYTWAVSDRPAVRPEDYMPGLQDIGEVLHISTIPDWKFIVEWYDDIAKTKSRSSYETQKLAAELFEGKEKLSDRDKVEIIYDYIVNEIRYSSVSFRQSGIVPQKASAVINTKVGDCKDVSTLFVALCGEVGIEADLVLVDTRDNGAYDLVLPSIDFNHCIAKVKLEDKEYYVELTSDVNAFSTFGWSLKKATVLDITPKAGEVSLLTLDPSTRLKNETIRIAEVSFNGDQMIIKKSNVKTGSLAAYTRSVYRDIGKEKREKTMLEAISDEYPSIKLTSLSFEDNLNNTSDSVTYEYGYTVDNAFQRIPKMEMLTLPWASRKKENLLAGDRREHPVELWQYEGSIDRNRETIILTLPEGKTLAELPKTVNLSCSVADYSMDFKMQGNKLVITREMKFKDDYIAMTNVESVKAFYEKVVKADQQQVFFRTK